MSSARAETSDFSRPWANEDRALVIDAYEYNGIDWNALASDERIAGFINKASDGLEPAYFCKGSVDEYKLCKTLWKRHAVARELFHTRRTVAKALGLKWGAYHLARPGNPIDQANHFLDFAEPEADDLIALDIEDNDPEKFMSLEDAEIFARHIHSRIGRYPVLYTNGSTAKYIADNRERYRLLSRLPLWYARYKPEIGAHFPKGHWQNYALWQFSSHINCNAKRCPYRVPGTKDDIDVNVATMGVEALREAWPFADLTDAPPAPLPQVPIPVARSDALAGDVEIAYADVELASYAERMENVLKVAGERYPERGVQVASVSEPQGVGEALAMVKDIELARLEAIRAVPGGLDPMQTVSIEAD
ncbi:glycoside hydrolase family 25 protein [Mesorhizobium xinjiangense]|uniref:glycoside hydrolase family 25 protein n=1 Tax=Mesorhizobium xinjiangense TaxID=2678685 RepID=UPI002E26714B